MSGFLSWSASSLDIQVFSGKLDYEDKLAKFTQSQVLMLLESIVLGYYPCPRPHHRPFTHFYISTHREKYNYTRTYI